ncbi:MAG: leucine-rich repeat domain-containing protein [Bacteroidales bacterium]|nr:leucine-rich repeat domain-containing protein [Bacteroidales bacterium]
MENFSYKYVPESDSFCAIGYQGHSPEVVVPSMHWGKPVTILFDNLFRGHAEIRSVLLPDTLTEIGACVFDGCMELRHIALPDSLESMWQYAFARCGLESVELPPKVTQVIPFTFFDCKRLQTVACGPNLKKIYAHAFQGCHSLVELRHSQQTIVSPDYKN